MREYLREKAAESRHDELSAYLMFIAGSVLFVGGLLETLFVSDEVTWFLFVPVSFSGTAGCLVGLALTLSGLTLMVYGLVVGTHYSRDRRWYMRELQNSSVVEENIVSRRKRGNAVSHVKK
jgi:hypothetical protein